MGSGKGVAAVKRLFLLSFVAIFALVAAGFFGFRQVAQSSDTEGVSVPPKAAFNNGPSQDPSFSVARNGPSGLSPADIFNLGPAVSIPCGGLGLNVAPLADCNPGVNQDNVNSLSYGADWWHSAKAGYHLFFSVAPGSLGLAGTAVAGEAGCPTAEPEADEFGSAGFWTNFQMFDGDGSDCGAGNAGGPVGLLEAQAAQPPNDDMDALDEFLEPQIAPGLVWFTLDPASPSLGPLMASPADILVVPANGGVAPWIYANAAALGLAAGDVIDALCLQDYDDMYSGFEPIWFSLEKNSPTLTANGWSGADILAAPPMMPVSRVVTAAQLGLAASDDLNALKCLYEVPEADKEVIEVRFDDASAYPGEGEPLVEPYEKPLGQNFKISVTSVEVNHGPWIPEDAQVNFYADIPAGCQGRWVVDPDVNSHDTLTIGGDPFADPMTPAQKGDMVSPTYPKVPGDGIEGTFESDLHFQTLDYGIDEPIYDPEDPTTLVPITRFFEIICLESSSHVFTFCNKIEAKDRIDNDGDGLIDEDPVDGIDNDDDGRYDEDAPEPMWDPNFANNVMCQTLELAVIAYADKEVEDIEFDDGDGTPLPDHPSKTDQYGVPLQVLDVPVSENHMISVTSIDLNNGPDPVADALVNFYADIPAGCEGRWVVDPAGANPFDTRTVEGDPFAPPFSPEQLGTTVAEDNPKEEGGNPWFESDLHYQTADYGLDEPAYTGYPHTRFFELHCFEPMQFHFNFCNKIEGKHTDDWDPTNNLRCEELVVEAVEPPEPHYWVYYAPGGPAPDPVSLETQFGLEGDVVLVAPTGLAAPAVKTRAGHEPEGALGPLHVRWFNITSVGVPPAEPPPAVNLYTQFQPDGYLNVEVGDPTALLAPTFKEIFPGQPPEPPAEPHYKCYELPTDLPSVDEYVTIETQFDLVEGVLVEEPFALCLPAGKNGDPIPDAPHLMCYWAFGPALENVYVNLWTQFFQEFEIPVYAPELLCVPAEKEVVSEAQDPSLSLHEGSSSFGVITPVWHTPNEADVLDANAPNPPNQTIPCGPAGTGLGLPACPPAAEFRDELNSLSYGVDFTATPPDGLHWLFFSVAPRSAGAYGSAVAGEFSCLGNPAATNPAPEPEADVFGTKALNDNIQNLDGDGQPCNGNSAPSVGLLEPKGDDLDALDEEGTDFVDYTGPEGIPDGKPDRFVYFSLDRDSPSLTALGFGSEDVLVTVGGGPPTKYADGVNDLGLQVDDEIDALCLDDIAGDDDFDGANDLMLFSLSARSPSVIAGTWSAADLIYRGRNIVGYDAPEIGLLDSDDVNALKCFQELVTTHGDPDTMPDQYENQHWCLDPTVDDANVDFEPDGLPGDPLTNAEELVLGTDPCVVDTDDDGCADGEEVRADGNQNLGGQRDPKNHWDFYDVPLPVGAPGTGARDKQIDGNDALAVLAKFGASPGDPIPTAPKYDPAYDRSVPTPNPWNTQAPEGVQDGNDVIWNLAQFGHSCVPAP